MQTHILSALRSASCLPPDVSVSSSPSIDIRVIPTRRVTAAGAKRMLKAFAEKAVLAVLVVVCIGMNPAWLYFLFVIVTLALTVALDDLRIDSSDAA
jgi:hypothetical protein